jgi:ABC-type branched-subunit amino acid transport system substrate-binding protein
MRKQPPDDVDVHAINMTGRSTSPLSWEEEMKKRILNWTASAIALAMSASAALADITIGVTIPITGPGAALGIPLKQSIELWPTEIAGEKL